MPETPKRVLIIDDEKDICQVLKLKLEKSNFQVVLAHDGQEGLVQTLLTRPDCIILDVRMPKEDGLTFLRKIRSFRDDDGELERTVRKTPVIVLTAAGENMKPLFRMEGISDYMEKPFDFEVLAKGIHKALA